MDQQDATPEAIGSDLLTGAEAIADHLNMKPRRVFHLLEHGLLPAFKLGRVWHARKSTLARHFDQLETEAAR